MQVRRLAGWQERCACTESACKQQPHRGAEGQEDEQDAEAHGAIRVLAHIHAIVGHKAEAVCRARGRAAGLLAAAGGASCAGAPDAPV